jgi:hypothetical protein
LRINIDPQMEQLTDALESTRCGALIFFASLQRRCRTRAMVATEARKARRMAAAAAKAAAEGKTLDATSLASAPVKPVPASAPLQARHRPAAHQNRAGAEAPSRAPHGASKEPILKGIGTKAGGKYTPPAILRAVANAARNKEARAGAGSGATAAAVDASNPNRADWTCAKCGKSNFAKRLACFKCASPKPGRVFTAAGMKGYEKRRARREAKRAASEAEGVIGSNPSAAEAAVRTRSAEASTSAPRKIRFRDGDEATTSRSGRMVGTEGAAADGGRDGDDANGGDGEKEKKEKKEKKRKRASKKASDAGRAPKRLRDPDAHLEYLARWSEATQERGDRPPEGFKPANGWKLDKNVQNWLIHNACDESEVDDDAFAMFLLYAAGLRGGPLERMRDAAGEGNRGKGIGAERARKVLRVLANVAS